jgi:hypothetical protein
MAMTLVSTVTVGAGGAASIEFTGIAGTGKDLLLLVSPIDPANNYKQLIFNLNDDELNLSGRRLQGSGSSASSGTNTGDTGDDGIQLGQVSIPSNTANTPASFSIYVANYASSSTKSFSVDRAMENNATEAYMGIFAGRYNSSSAVTAVKLKIQDTTFSQHSTASLYIIS